MTLFDIIDHWIGVNVHHKPPVDKDSAAAMRDTNRQVDEVRKELDEMDAYVHAAEVSLQSQSRGRLFGKGI